jgi:hypothetical protein
MPLATLGGIPLHTNPNEIRWNYSMKVSDTKCLGGKVVQILGTTLSDLTLTGYFGNGRKDKGDKEGWEQQLRFRDLVRKWADTNIAQGKAKPIRFTYAPRNWDFQVFVKSISDVHHEITEINPKWQLVLFPVDEGSRDIVRSVQDLYLKRLMTGIGWKQTAYNGPTQAEVDNTLAGRTVEEYLQDRFQAAFEAPNGNLADDGTS